MDAFQGVNDQGQRVNIVALDIPYMDLLIFSFKFLLAWIPAVLIIYGAAFLLFASCFGTGW